MSTISIERAKLKAFITGFLSDPAHDNQSSRSLTTEVFRIALASLEAEPVADERAAFEAFMEGRFNDSIDRKRVKNGDQGYFAWDMIVAWIVWQGRAAMLQGAEHVTTAYKLPAIGWLRADYQNDNRGLRGNAPLFVLGKKDPSTVWGLDYIPLTSNSPVVLDGACPCCGRKQLKSRTCSVSGCDAKHVAHGFCKKHYDIERKKDPSRRESIRAADKRYRARKAVVPHQEVR